MANNDQTNTTRQPSFAERFNEIQNANMSYRQVSNAIRDHPLASVFVGTFLTTSAIPLTVFLCFVCGSFIFGALTLFAVQGGIVFISTLTLLSTLVIPFFFSAGIATAVLCGWIALRLLQRLIDSFQHSELRAPVEYITHHPLVEHPMETCRDMASRIGSRMLELRSPFTTANTMRDNQGPSRRNVSGLHNERSQSSRESTRVLIGERLAGVETGERRTGVETGEQSHHSDSEHETHEPSPHYGHELRDCAERLRQSSSPSGSETEDSPRGKRKTKVGHLGTIYDWSSDDEPLAGPLGFPPQAPPHHGIPSLSGNNDPQIPSVRLRLGPLLLRAATMNPSPVSEPGHVGMEPAEPSEQKVHLPWEL